MSKAERDSMEATAKRLVLEEVVLERLKELPADEIKHFFGTLTDHYCQYCWEEKPSSGQCYCWNDE